MTLNLSADEVLTTTRAVRKRLDFEKPVPREVLTECLELALQAPTGSNAQGWQWVFVDDAEKKKALADIYRTNATPASASPSRSTAMCGTNNGPACTARRSTSTNIFTRRQSC